MTTGEGKARKRLPIGVLVVCVLGGLVVVAALVARFRFFLWYRQPSGSMYPAHEVGDTFFANGFERTPVRGQVFVFEFPERRDQLFDKRVVGLPGETVTTKGRAVLIDGWEIPRCMVGKHSYEVDGERHEGELEVEFLGDAAYLVFHDGAPWQLEAGPWLVKEGEYFVLGDNRNNSHDWRLWFAGAGGGVPFGHTIGHVREPAIPPLPRNADGLRPALEACLAKRPQKTMPR